MPASFPSANSVAGRGPDHPQRLSADRSLRGHRRSGRLAAADRRRAEDQPAADGTDRRPRPGAARPAGRRRRRELIMAPFIHVSAERAEPLQRWVVRVLYAGRTFEVALMETITTMRASWRGNRRGAGLDITIPRDRARYRRAFCTICGAVVGPSRPCSIPTTTPQPSLRAANPAGAVRGHRLSERPLCTGANAPACSIPDRAAHAVQGRHLDYHWNGERVDLVRDLSAGQVFRVVP